MSEACPGTEQLERLLRETLTEAEQIAVLQHLDLCGACRQRLEQTAGGPAWVSSGALTPGPRAPSPAKLEQFMKQFRAQPPSTKCREAAVLKAATDFLQPSPKAGVLGLLGSYEVMAEIVKMDVSQEVLRAVVRAMETFEYDPQRGKFRNWLLTVVRSKMNNLLARFL